MSKYEKAKAFLSNREIKAISQAGTGKFSVQLIEEMIVLNGAFLGESKTIQLNKTLLESNDTHIDRFLSVKTESGNIVLF